MPDRIENGIAYLNGLKVGDIYGSNYIEIDNAGILSFKGTAHISDDSSTADVFKSITVGYDTNNKMVVTCSSIGVSKIAMTGSADSFEIETGDGKIILDAGDDIDLDPAGDDINLLGAAAGKITLAAASITMYGGDTTGDALVLQGSSANAGQKIAITGASGIVLTGYTSVSAIPTIYSGNQAFSVGSYSTPIVETSGDDNILASFNFATATNKTAPDTSHMTLFVGCSNTAATANAKMQAILGSTTLHGNIFDAYAVQGHITVHDSLATLNANAHITGISGKALLSAAVTQGWVTGILGILDGTGAVTGMCYAGSLQIEAGVTGMDGVLSLGSDAASTPCAIDVLGNANMTYFVRTNASTGGFVSTRATPNSTAVCDAGILCMIGAKALYIPAYNAVTIA